ncbi:MAG: hypothetical protein E6G97_16885 [Alphaproteobacteria bacterium]|nr:MAG: hypothetical protein E6G97_16885 [Alphaproteobacteria bacterium]
MGLFDKFADAAGQAKNAATDLAASATAQAANAAGKATQIKEAAAALASDMTVRSATAADVRQLFNIIEKIPGLEEAITDVEKLTTSLAIIEMGSTSYFITFDENGLGFSMARGSIESAALIAQKPDLDGEFSSVILSKGRQEGERDMRLFINEGHFIRNSHLITADLLAAALISLIENVPFIGRPLSVILDRPIRSIAVLLILTTQTEVMRAAALAAKARSA